MCLWGRHTDLSFVEPGLLVDVFKKLEEIYLYDQLSHEQSDQLFSAIAENMCRLKVLKVWDESTIKLSPQLFASAVSNVDQVVLGSPVITHEQMEALFIIAVTEKGGSLRKLDLFSCNTYDIEPALMGEAVNRLEEFRVANTWVESDQITAILEYIVEGGSRLNKLKLCDLDYGEFGEVHPALVKQAEDKFGKFYGFDHDYSDSYESDTDEYEEDVGVEGGNDN
jgi:hypothetical protein